MPWPIFLLTAVVLCGQSSAVAAGPPPQTPIRTADFVRVDGQGPVTIQDPEAPVSFELPRGWVLRQGMRWGDHETTLSIFDTTSHRPATVYYQYPIQSKVPFDLDAALREDMAKKVKQRQDREGFKDYRIREGSGQTSVVDGRPSWSFIGDFTTPQLQRITEYQIRILGANTKAEFFFMMPSGDDLPAFVELLRPVIQTLRMP